MIYKKLLCMILSLIYLGIFLTANNLGKIKDNFKQGISAYEKENYKQALEFFLKAEKTGVHFKLFYNIGNSYYKINDYLNAKIYYLKALKSDPANKSIRDNIEIVNKKFKDEIIKTKGDFLENVLLKIESITSMNILSIIILLAVIILNAKIFILMRHGKKKWLIYGVAFLLIFLLIMSGYFVHRVKKQNKHNFAVVQLEETQLRSGPGESHTILYKVHLGLKVRIINSSQGWVYVSASTEINGWILEGSLVEI